MISFLQGPAILCAFVFMLIAYTLNIHWRLSLFYNGLEFIKHIQKLFPSSTMIVIQNLVSILCTSWFKMLIIAIVAIALKRKIRVMVFVVFFISNVYLNSLSKLLFADPRPFWYTTNILQLEWKCPGQFGNPSGHSRDAAIFYYILIYDILLRRGGLGYWWTAIVFVWVSVPFSRLYLGAHSSNQVILGLLIGLAWLVVYKFSLQKGIYDIFNGLIRRKHLWQITSILAAYFVTIMIPIFAYEFKLRNLTTTERFISNMMVGCPYTKANTAIKVLNGTFATCGIASLIFGLLVGVWSSQIGNYRYIYGQWKYSQYSFMSRIFRAAVEVLPGITAFIIFGSWLLKFTINIYLKYLLINISLFLGAFLPIYLSRRILLACNIIEQRSMYNPSHQLAVSI